MSEIPTSYRFDTDNVPKCKKCGSKGLVSLENNLCPLCEIKRVTEEETNPYDYGLEEVYPNKKKNEWKGPIEMTKYKYKIEMIIIDNNPKSPMPFGERVKRILELSGYEVEIIGVN